jgi:hypothetical protein
MGTNDFINMIVPYLMVFICILFVVCCFMRNCYCGMTAMELREIRERHEEEMRQNEIRLARRIEALRQQENENFDENFDEFFRNDNINRLELADALSEYAKYLKEKMEMERKKNEEDIVIFINPGNAEPVLGQLMTDD